MSPKLLAEDQKRLVREEINSDHFSGNSFRRGLPAVFLVTWDTIIREVFIQHTTTLCPLCRREWNTIRIKGVPNPLHPSLKGVNSQRHCLVLLTNLLYPSLKGVNSHTSKASLKKNVLQQYYLLIDSSLQVLFGSISFVLFDCVGGDWSPSSWNALLGTLNGHDRQISK